ncbi:zf-TFIIB domain-containing protein [uncultured Stenotrophomonas sp.]|uniref:zf-TFIIB domain-containing protein n=1 Tax=uncultured Stenotrophomonas sp. TaxID=165438 RepID=UPI0025CFED35|nr:zf-TFIIB domain-containing protein [uncultured Stenotrophomonas sp.]
MYVLAVNFPLTHRDNSFEPTPFRAWLDSLVLPDGETGMQCPKCNSELKPITHGDVEIDRCSGCGGLWFDAFEHEELKQLDGSERIDYSPKTTVPPNTGAGKCPKDQQPLFAMVVAGQPHISYESCGFCHGVFFDAGEFKDFKEETFAERFRALFGLATTVPAER